MTAQAHDTVPAARPARRADAGTVRLGQRDTDGLMRPWLLRTAVKAAKWLVLAAAACRDFARAVLGATRLIAIIHPDNRPSQRVAEKIGLRPEKHATVHGGRAAVIYAAVLGDGKPDHHRW